MRIVSIFSAIALGGCASTTDLGNSLSVSVTAFSGSITSSEQLAVDLEKDFARKSEQLEYVSRGSYSCGDPRDPNIRKIEAGAQAGALKVKKDAIKELRTKNAYINAILGYGDTVGAYVKQQANLDAELAKWTTAIGTLTGLVSSKETAAFAAVAKAIIADIQQGDHLYNHDRIKAYATKIGPHLAANVDYLVKTRHLRDLTAEEEQAFQLWNACARERLRFVRGYYPPTIGAELRKPYPAMAPSPVWDFMNAYQEYITEREGFIGRKPDFGALLQAIVKANDAIIEDKQDPVDVINAMGVATKAVEDSSTGIRKAANSI